MSSRLGRITKVIKERIVWSDFTRNLELKPITGQLSMNYNIQAVIQSIENLVEIYPTEIYYHPLIGSLVSRSNFDFADEFNATRLKDSILQTINNFEPRAQSVNVVVTPFPQDAYFNVDIYFTMAPYPNQTFQVPTFPVRVR